MDGSVVLLIFLKLSFVQVYVWLILWATSVLTGLFDLLIASLQISLVRFTCSRLTANHCDLGWSIRSKYSSHPTSLKAGFYLGYLRDRSFPPPKYPGSPQKILLSLQYVSNYIRKIIQTRQGQCTWSKYSLSKDTIWQGTWSIICWPLFIYSRTNKSISMYIKYLWN